jgi:hypothetical protein
MAIRKDTPMIRHLFPRPKDRFQPRSPERDAHADNEAVRSIASAISLALAKAEAERAGLKKRLDHVISIAAVVGGNDIDEYLTRTDDRWQMLGESDAEIRRGEERLRMIERNIAHFNFLMTPLQTCFPDWKI